MNLDDFYLWASPESRGDAAGGDEPDPSPARHGDPVPDGDDLKTEKEQLERARKDRTHFDYFVGKYYTGIFGYVFRSSNDHDVAADIAHETFIRAWKNLEGFEWRGRGLGPWLFTIANHLLKRHMRQKSRRQETRFVEGRHDPLDVQTPDRIVGRDRDLELTRRCIGRLPWAQQQVLILHLWEDMTVREIAQVTELPLGTVNSHLRRGRIRVAERMAEDDIWPLLTEATRRSVRDALRKDRNLRLVDGRPTDESPEAEKD